MKKTILTYGLIAGIVIIGNCIIAAYSAAQQETPRFSELAGYLVMIVALSLIFVGVKRYRDRQLGGVIRFGTAFLLGLGITAVASVIYVAAWEVNLSLTDYAFANDYTRSLLALISAAVLRNSRILPAQ